jgi:glutamate-1-semialdehyde 2,1-aminomutase
MSMGGISPDRIEVLKAVETDHFIARTPRSRALHEAAAAHFPDGVPMHWMRDWPGPYPLFLARASGACIEDADGNVYEDFCLGDTGAMFGHGPPAVQAAISRQLPHGLTAMLPSEAAVRVGPLLAERFGLPFWQMTMTATDANRYAIRWARAISGRHQLLLFNGCYHGSADDSFVRLEDGQSVLRRGLIGQVYDVRAHSRVIEFNDLAALEAALAPGDVAALLAEPFLTNIGMVAADAGYWDAACALLRRHGTLLILDETHTLSSGPGGYARANGIAADMLTLGKPIAGGLPAALYGMSAQTAVRAAAVRARHAGGYSGMGTTLSANALVCAAMLAMLEQVMTPAAYAHMLALADRAAAGLRALIHRHGAPWSVVQVGARIEFVCASPAPRNGGEAAVALHAPLHELIHLHLMNKGVLIAPFHNMLLLSPVTAAEQVDRLLDALDGCMSALFA